MLEILKEELVKSMQLCGVASISDLTPEIVDAHAVTNHTALTIPPSPFTMRPAAVQPKVEQARTPTELRAEIAKMQVLLDEAEGRTSLSAVDQTLLFSKSLFSGVLSGIFTQNFPTLLHRTALVLYAYMFLIALGSLFAFTGADGFNAFQAVLERSYLFAAMQVYVLLAFVGHLALAGLQMKNRMSYIMANPLKNGVLNISGTVFLYLVYVHYVNFYESPEAIPLTAAGAKDYFLHESNVFADVTNLIIYILGVSMIAWHLQVGWPKTVNKMAFPEQERKIIAKVGVAATYPLALALLASPVAFYLHSSGYQVL